MVTCGLCRYQKTRLSYLKNNYQYYFCPRCQTFFIHPFPTNNALKTYYKKFTNSAPHQEKLIRSRSKQIINQLKKFNSSGLDLIDIGCGYGFFLDEARQKHLNVLGIEPSTQSFKYVKSSLRLNAKNINLEKFLQRNRRKFDFLIYSHVIEHIKDPIKVISQLSNLLKPRGVLYIETPNINSHLFRTEKENYTFLLPPEHLWLFSLKSFNYMIPSNLSLVQVNTISQPEHLMGIIKNIFKKSQVKNSTQTINLTKQTQNLTNKSNGTLKQFKYLLLDKSLAPLFTPLLNHNNQGSILQIYLRKK